MIVKDFRRKPKNRKKYRNNLLKEDEIICKKFSEISFSYSKINGHSRIEKTYLDTYNSEFLYPLLTEVAHQNGILSYEHFFSQLLSKNKIKPI